MTREHVKNEIKQLSTCLRKYQEEYYINSRPSIPDKEYDRLFDRLLLIEKQYPEFIEPDSPTHRVGSDLIHELPEVEHNILVLSLDKSYYYDDIASWINKCNNSSQQPLSFICEEKIDGASIVLYYQEGILVRAVTRGNGLVGNDVTANVKTIRSVPLKLSQAVNVIVRGEIFLTKDFFQEINKKLTIPYANPRNLASGTLRRIKSAYVAKVPLDIFVYEGFFQSQKNTHSQIIVELQSLGFKVNNNIGLFSESLNRDKKNYVHSDWTVGIFKDLKEFLKKETELRKTLPYEIDGIVIKVNEIPIREQLGYTGHHPRWAIAYKFEAPQGVTKVKKIDIQVGRTGRITPVARIEPVAIAGSTISNVTLHNQEYIDMLELALSDTVAVSKRGDVIPALEHVLEKNDLGNKTWKMPLFCPSCGSSLKKRGAHHYCLNPVCHDKIRGQLHFFAGSGQMDIENLGPETIDFLFGKGIIKNIEDIYIFNPDELLKYPGFGEKKVELIRQGIEKSKTQPFHIVLKAMGLPEVGEKVIELLIGEGYRDIDTLLKVVQEDRPDSLLPIHGIGERVASIIFKELSKDETLKRIATLKALGLNFKEEETIFALIPIFKDQVWCITGSFESFKPRDKAKEEITKRGGVVTSNVSANTTHLLAGSSPGSKYQKALTLNIIIVKEEEFIRLISK